MAGENNENRTKPADNGTGAAATNAPRARKTPPVAWRMGVWGALGLVVFVLDQAAKAAVRTAVADGWVSTTLIPGLIDLTFVRNFGAAFGLGWGFGFVSVGIAVVVVAFSVWYLLHASHLSWLEVVGLGLVLGGAVGNALDRLVFGFVTDFIATTFIDFPVFNIADMGIVVGVVLTCAGFMFFSPDARGDDAACGGSDRTAR